jgi:hypothetical protein
VPEHRLRLAGAQQVAVVDAVGPGEDRVHERHHLAPRPGGPGPAAEVDGLVDEALQPEPVGEGRRQDEAGAGHRPIVVEDDLQPSHRRSARFARPLAAVTIWVTS